jgi:hypothetical protein
VEQTTFDLPIYRLRPSNKSWLLCPGSIQACEGIPDETTDAAELGTAIHELAELCLKQGTAPEEYLGYPIYNGMIVDEDMVEVAAYYVDFCNGQPG